MAFYNDDDENQQDPNAQATGQQTAAGSSVITGGSGAAGPQPKAPNSPDSPGNFVGIKQYLDANKNQSSKLGTQVAGQLTNSNNDAQNSIIQAGDSFNEAAKGPDFEVEKTKATDTLNKAGTQPLGAEDVNQFKGAANAQYAGPKSLADTNFYQPAVAKVNIAQQNADLSKTEPGQQQLLSNLYSKPTYSSGEKRLDSYLLGSQENRDKLSQAAAPAKNLQGSLQQANASSQGVANQKTQQAEQLRQSIAQAMGVFDDPNTPQNEATGALGDYQNTINNQLSTKQSDVAGLQDRLNNNNMSAEDKTALGIPDVPSNFGVKYDNYFNPGLATAAGVTTPEEKARYDALLQLSGMDQSGANPLYSGSSPGDFGSYKPTFNSNAYQQSVNDAEGAYSADSNNLINQYNQNVLPSLISAGTGNQSGYNNYVEQNGGADRIGYGGKAATAQDAAGYLNRIIQLFGPNSQGSQLGSDFAQSGSLAQDILRQLNENQRKYNQDLFPVYGSPNHMK